MGAFIRSDAPPSAWLVQFARQVDKENIGVPPKSGQSFVDQIQEMLSGKASSKFSTVQEKVDEMKERSGLSGYINSLNIKKASAGIPAVINAMEPKLRDSILSYLHNQIENHHGQVSLPAVQHDLMQTFRSQGLEAQQTEDPEFVTYVKSLLDDSSASYPDEPVNHNLGKGLGVLEVEDNQDYFQGMDSKKK